jgi:hypothetical protein
MLTWSELEVHVTAGRLMLWDPKKQGVTPGGRGLYMLPCVYDSVLKKPWPGTAAGESKDRVRSRRQAMRQVLERFVLGGRLNLNTDIAELGSKIHRPEHRGFWEFRSMGPWVETRLFGFFARVGAFVATDLQARDGIDFRAQHASCLGKWNLLTGSRPVLAAPYPVGTPAELEVYLGGTR